MGIRMYINDVIDPVFLQAVYIYLFLRADENGEIKVTAKQIAAHFGTDATAIRRLIRELAVRGFIKVLKISSRIPYRKGTRWGGTFTIQILDYKTRKDFLDSILPKPVWSLDINELIDKKEA